MGLPGWVLNAVKLAPWDACVSQGFEHLAYADCGMPIDSSRVTLPPIAMASALHALAPKANDSVLEIGSSVMRMTSIFSKLCCSVFLLEPNNERYLADCKLANDFALRNVNISLGVELPLDHLYDIIILNSEVDQVPEFLLNILHENGRLCFIENSNLILIQKFADRVVHKNICLANTGKIKDFNHNLFEL